MNIVHSGQVREWVGSGGRKDVMVETEPIRITLEQKAFLDIIGSKKDSYADIVGRLIEFYKQGTENMKEAKVDEWGKVMISRKLKGKTINYLVKEE